MGIGGRRAVFVAVVAGVVAVFAGSGCSLIMDLKRFNEAPVDGGLDGGAEAQAASPWSCLSLPSETLDPSVSAAITIVTYDPLSKFTSAGSVDGGSDLDYVVYTPIVGVPVRSCASTTDVQCTVNGSPFQDTNDAGQATFVVQQDFSGFFDLQPAGLLPLTLYPARLAEGQTSASYFVPLESAQTAELASSVLGIPVEVGPDAGVGQLFIGVFDCEDHNAANVAFTLSNFGAQTVLFYLKGGIPSATATQTDSLGAAGVYNAPPGQTTISATLLPDRIPLGNASVVVRPGAITDVFLRIRTH